MTKRLNFERMNKGGFERGIDTENEGERKWRDIEIANGVFMPRQDDKPHCKIIFV